MDKVAKVAQAAQDLNWAMREAGQTGEHKRLCRIIDGPGLADLQASYTQYSRRRQDRITVPFTVKFKGELIKLGIVVTGVVSGAKADPPGTDLVGAIVVTINGKDPDFHPAMHTSRSGAHATMVFCRAQAYKGDMVIDPLF